MTFRFSRSGLTGRDRVLERFFEVLPGATSWTLLLGMTCLAFWKPVTAAVLIITFDLYWLLRLFYMTLLLVASYLRLAVEQQTDWMARVQGLDRLPEYRHLLTTQLPPSDVRPRISEWIHRNDVLRCVCQGLSLPRSDEIYHLVIFPVSKEPRAILEPGMESLARQTFEPRRILIVLALEARAPRVIQADVEALAQQYRGRFLDILVITHPEGLPGEARVKGANTTHAAKAAAADFEARGVPLEQIIVSCFDADTVVSTQYIACLTYCFLTCPERTHASFQPIPVYHNNIWDVPGFARVLDIGASFFQLIEAANPEKLVTFSSHSMSFKALVDVGYWPVDLISDDSAIFWKAFIHFDGRYRVVPMPITLSMDVVAASSWWRTAMNVYRQKRRWAWGVENFPIVMRAFVEANQIRLWTKLRHAFKLFESHVAWATWAFLLTIIGSIPALGAGREFSSSVVYYSAPRITMTIFSLASVALVITIVLSFCLLPKTTVTRSLWRRIGHAFEWVLVPFVSVGLSAVPALDAQTRLMVGRYLEFWVTDKTRGMMRVD